MTDSSDAGRRREAGPDTEAAQFVPIRRERRNGAVRIVEIARRLGAAELGTTGSDSGRPTRAASAAWANGRSSTAGRRGFSHPPDRLVGFTRDLSESGMCLGLDEAAPVGCLLDVTLCGLDGKPERRALGRVMWARPDFDTRVWHGVKLLSPSASAS